DLRLVVEVGARHVHESPGLFLDRGDHLGMGVAGRDDRDASREIEEPVAVDVRDPAALSPVHDKRVGAGEAGRHRPGIAGDQGGRLGSRDRGLEKGLLTFGDHARENTGVVRLTADQVRIVNGKNFATVATLMPDGSPEATVIWIETDGTYIYFNTAMHRLKARNLQRDP